MKKPPIREELLDELLGEARTAICALQIRSDCGPAW